MTAAERIAVLYAAGQVKRMHTIPTVREHTVAEHTCGAMFIAKELCTINGIGSTCVLLELLYHDTPELETGDMPAPTKRATNGCLDAMELEFYDRLGITIQPLTNLERAIVKAADRLDLIRNCIREKELGNRSRRLDTVVRNCSLYLQDQKWVSGVEDLRSIFVEEYYGHA